MIIAATQYGSSDALNIPIYTYTGTAPTLYKDVSGNWELVFKKNCTITFQWLNTTVDIFAVGGGAAGAQGSHESIWDFWDGATTRSEQDKATGGNGGAGGACVTTQSPITLAVGKKYQVNIGSSGQSTSLPELNISAAAGANNGGATGASAYKGNSGSSYINAGTAGNGSLAFGRTGATAADRTLYEADLGETVYFGADGGGGYAYSQTLGNFATASDGGTTGGGNGGTNDVGSAASPNTGSGGGGGAAKQNWAIAAGGSGGSGIVIIRNHRS